MWGSTAPLEMERPPGKAGPWSERLCEVSEGENSNETKSLAGATGRTLRAPGRRLGLWAVGSQGGWRERG